MQSWIFQKYRHIPSQKVFQGAERSQLRKGRPRTITHVNLHNHIEKQRLNEVKICILQSSIYF